MRSMPCWCCISLNGFFAASSSYQPDADADADWGRHDYRGKDAHGNDWCKTVTWFGYKLHLVADTDHDLPFDFRVEKANSSETRVCREMVAEILSDEEVRER